MKKSIYIYILILITIPLIYLLVKKLIENNRCPESTPYCVECKTNDNCSKDKKCIKNTCTNGPKQSVDTSFDLGYNDSMDVQISMRTEPSMIMFSNTIGRSIPMPTNSFVIGDAIQFTSGLQPESESIGKSYIITDILQDTGNLKSYKIDDKIKDTIKLGKYTFSRVRKNR
jgi:hypothetical protein